MSEPARARIFCLRDAGLVTSEWRDDEGERARRYYSITPLEVGRLARMMSAGNELVRGTSELRCSAFRAISQPGRGPVVQAGDRLQHHLDGGVRGPGTSGLGKSGH